MTQDDTRCSRFVRESLMSYGIVCIVMMFCEVAGHPFFDLSFVLVVTITILAGIPAVLLNRTLPK